MSSADLMAMMNDHSLLKGGSIKGSLLQGNNRDADGTIDRVRDPPKELLPLLKKIKRLMDMENVDLHCVFENQGGTKYGTMVKTRFVSTLRDLMLKVHFFTEAEIHEVCKAYGTGGDDLHCPGEKESMAWMDFVEDCVKMDASFMPAHLAPPLNSKPKPMSAFAMMMDASDGSMDGNVDLDAVAHTTLMGDKRWA